VPAGDLLDDVVGAGRVQVAAVSGDLVAQPANPLGLGSLRTGGVLVGVALLERGDALDERVHELLELGGGHAPPPVTPPGVRVTSTGRPPGAAPAASPPSRRPSRPAASASAAGARRSSNASPRWSASCGGRAGDRPSRGRPCSPRPPAAAPGYVGRFRFGLGRFSRWRGAAAAGPPGPPAPPRPGPRTTRT